MVTRWLFTRAFAGLSLFTGFGATAQAQLPPITPEGAFKVQPRQPGVNVTTPAPNQVPNCKVEPIPNPNTKDPMGYVVRDPAGQPVRQFVSYDGKSYNIIAFYVNGEEAYREVYPPAAGQAYQFRWLGPNGTKWGLDHDRDSKIDEWAVISPEELSQELLAAVLTKDEKRAQALVVTKANIDALGLKGPEADKRLERAAGAARRAIDAANGLKAGGDAKWVHVELGVPQATPKDSLQSADDLVVHKNGTVLVQDGKDSKFLQTGELIQVGRAWKLVDGPSADAAPGGGGVGALPAGVEGLLKQINDLDANPPKEATREANAAHNVKRAEILEQIVAKLEPKDQETWARLLADALGAAAEVEKPDGKYISRLKQLKDALAKGPNPNLAAYVAFRHLVTENGLKMISPDANVDKLQEEWRAALDAFAKAFPNSEEAPEALLRLGLAYEYMKDRKEGEAKAKETYKRIAEQYTRHPNGAKAQGAIRRLESDGKPFELAGGDLEKNGAITNITALKGKVVVVYYCANWSSTLPDDSRKLQALVKEFGPKGVEVVTVCLDPDMPTAQRTVADAKLPGLKINGGGGLETSILAQHYGILVVPHTFVLDREGKVVNRNAHPATVEEDVKKLVQ